MRGRTRYQAPTSKVGAVAQCLFWSVCALILGCFTFGVGFLLLPLIWWNLANELTRLSGSTSRSDQVFVGPRGGRYRINSKGKKVYDV
jgi:hypothetical protein